MGLPQKKTEIPVNQMELVTPETEITPPPEKSKTSASDLLAKMNSKTASKSKSKVEIIDNKDLYEIVDNVIDAKAELDSAQAKYDNAESQLVEKSNDWYKGKTGRESSVKYQGTKGLKTVSYKNMFCKIPIEHKGLIEEKLGDKFEGYFKEKRDIKLIDTKDETIELLLELLGDKFTEIFEVKLELAVTERMNEEQFSLPEEIRDFVKQYKPAVK